MTAARHFITTQAGLLYAILDSLWVIVLVAVVVAIFAELQYYGAGETIKRTRGGPD